MIMRMIRDWLRKSPHVHVRQSEAETMSELVALLDRFLDNNLQYVLEWDDFISWRAKNPNIEIIRERIARTEPLFFSDVPGDLAQGVETVVDERNRAAALVGLPPRTAPGP